jgi:UDP-N-acetylmuramoyl-L-alanyl-D-glutamate--2,6-diaminopimelate ligase
VPEVVVDDVREAMAPAAARLNGDPTARLAVAGITGTNGKTTTAFLLRAILEAAGRRTGLLGTVANVVGGQEAPPKHTTPEAIDLQRTFATMLEAGDTHCAMEVSSHALALHRADCVHWAVAVFTNLSRDHLDFHPTMDDYFAAKKRLFDAGPAHKVICTDDEYGRRLAAEHPDAVTVSLDDVEVTPGPHGSVVRDGALELVVPLPGRFNVLNALCAVAAARALGVDDEAIAAALPDARTAPGRFEPVDEGQGFAVIVDYAHTPDSLQNVLQAARALSDGRVICVFGAGGDRDRDKRPMMGEIASREADVAIVTSDNPRSEDPAEIVRAITAGALRPMEVELDRRTAIGDAVDLAQDGDVVVIAGKGHEQGQELAGGHVVPFDDATVAREALRARLAA